MTKALALLWLSLLVLALPGCMTEAEPQKTTAPTGRWLAEDIGGAGVIDDLQSVLELAADGTVGGSGGCNRMAGTATIDGDSIAFGPLAATKMACAPAVMDQEAKFFAALDETRRWQLDQARDKLLLLDADGHTLLVLTRD